MNNRIILVRIAHVSEGRAYEGRVWLSWNDSLNTFGFDKIDYRKPCGSDCGFTHRLSKDGWGFDMTLTERPNDWSWGECSEIELKGLKAEKVNEMISEIKIVGEMREWPILENPLSSRRKRRKPEKEGEETNVH